MITGITAVIAVTRSNVMVVGIKPYGAVAHASIQRQFFAQLPLCLQIGIDVPHQIAFVTAQLTFLPVFRHAAIQAEVIVAFAIFTHVFVVQAGSERERNAQLATVCPAAVYPLIMALQSNHAARMRRVKLWCHRD